MKKLSILCEIAWVLTLMVIPAFPLSYEFDFDNDQIWDTSWTLEPPPIGESVQLKIWLGDYVAPEDKLFSVTLYFQYDITKINVVEVIPNDSMNGGPFDYPSCTNDLGEGVFRLDLASFLYVTVSENKILLFTITLQSIAPGIVTIKAANSIDSFFDGGYVADMNTRYLCDKVWCDHSDWILYDAQYPTDASATIYQCSEEDTDSDGVGNGCDNCPEMPNGQSLGTCIDCDIASTGITCTSDNNCQIGESCAKNQEKVCSDDFDDDGVYNNEDDCICSANQNQEDTYPPGGNDCGDACECEADFEQDGDVDGTDAIKFKIDFGRKPPTDPCSALNPCDGDFDCDGNVDGSDACMLKKDFGRRNCPYCGSGSWCTY